jgi:hypothetical protein
MKIYTVDCEGNGLVPDKFYVLSYRKEGKDQEVKSITSPDIMKKFLTQEDATFIIHNGIRWDKPNLERVLGIKIKARIIDTLFISWYIYPTRILHGLESYGEDFGVPKPVIDDWHSLTLDQYIHRCEEDVKINYKTWERQKKSLAVLYNCTEDEVLSLPIIDYLMFKAGCAAEQERSKWRLDTPLIQNTLQTLYKERTDRVEGLKVVMPRVEKKALRKPPTKPYKKDGTLSVQGAKWVKLCKDNNLPPTHKDPIEVVIAYEDPNPSSSDQVKNWLYSLGWEPMTLNYVREDDGSTRVVPQVRTKDKELCPSVLELLDKEPNIELLDGLTVVNHRISILEGFISNVDEDGFIKAEIQGLTNTLRFKHKIVVNLPGVDKPYGKEIRGALIARDGYELMGSDINSLEDMTKRHYIYPYDPDYVKEMSHPDFDSHLDLAIRAGRISKDDAVSHVRGEKDFSKIRKPFKAVNYSAIYGVGVPKLARELRVPEKEAKSLLGAYWDRNWSIKKLAEDTKIKQLGGQMWLYNPVSKFWYSLRYTKDIFSTLNQGTGVFVFDTWLKYVREKRKQMTAQFHDEGVWEIKKGFRQQGEALLRYAMKKANEQLNLNVTIDIDVQFGQSYADIH